MSTRKRRSSSKSKKKSSGASPSRQRKVEVLGLVLIALSLLLTLAVVTHSPSDDRLLAQVESVDTLMNEREGQVDNLLGPIGAIVSETLVTDLLGYPVLLLLGVLCAWGWVLLRRKTTVYLPMLTGLAFAGALFFACLMAWVDNRTDDVQLASWSGGLGAGVEGWVESLVGPVGAFIVLVVALVVVVLLVWDRDIQAHLERAETALGGVSASLAAGWARYRESARTRKELMDSKRAERQADREKVRREKAKARQPKESSISPAQTRKERRDAQVAQRQLKALEARAEEATPDPRPAPPPLGDG
ncbi:MAG: DNA translocase FtsK 4TM domain-containing protein, partial [Bacteroidota bacterium]